MSNYIRSNQSYDEDAFVRTQVRGSSPAISASITQSSKSIPQRSGRTRLEHNALESVQSLPLASRGADASTVAKQSASAVAFTNLETKVSLPQHNNHHGKPGTAPQTELPTSNVGESLRGPFRRQIFLKERINSRVYPSGNCCKASSSGCTGKRP